MKPSERVKEVLPGCVELWTEKARQSVTTNSFAPSKEEWAQLLKGTASSMEPLIMIDAYASAILLAIDEERERTDRAIAALLNEGSFPGDS